jgi:hypothetical protein
MMMSVAKRIVWWLWVVCTLRVYDWRTDGYAGYIMWNCLDPKRIGDNDG